MSKSNRQLSQVDVSTMLATTFADEYLEKAPPNFIHTRGGRLIISRLNAALKMQKGERPFVVVAGPAGSGKTTTVKQFCSDKEVGYIRCYPGFGHRELLVELARYLRLNVARNYLTRLSTVADVLGTKRRMIAFDEAQLMDDKCIDMTRYLSEVANVVFVFVMTDEHAQRLDQSTDFRTRVFSVAKVSPLGLNEFQEIFGAVGFSADARAEIYSLTGGIMRDIYRLIDQIDDFVDINRESGITRGDLEAFHIVAIAQKLSLASSTK